jgi:preprotein translocase subunit SecE
MARDRKRAKQRRQRQAAARPAQRVPRRGTPTPDPLDHASGEVDIARSAELGAEPLPPDADADFDEESAFEAAEEELAGEEGYDPDLAADELQEPGAALPARRRAAVAGRGRGEPAERREGNRLVNFLRASWRELKRVQWPDRRQVTQATGVVIGFVIVAGAFLGLMDALWSRFVDAII